MYVSLNCVKFRLNLLCIFFHCTVLNSKFFFFKFVYLFFYLCCVISNLKLGVNLLRRDH